MNKAKRKLLKIAYYTLLLLTFICTILALNNGIVFQWFGLVPVILACIAVVLRAFIGYKKDKGITYQHLHSVLIPALVIALIIIIGFWGYLANPREFHNEITSPFGSTTIIVEYDLVSRPSVYIKRNAIFMTPVPIKGLVAGYNETIHFDIEWISDTQISMTNYLGEEFIVDLFP